MKCEIQNFTIKYSKNLAKEWKEDRTLLENKMKELERNWNTRDNIQSYNIYIKELDSIYDHITECFRIRSKYDWYKHGKVNKVFFLNLDKKHGNQNQIRKLIFNENEIDEDVEISIKIKSFYETLLKSQSYKSYYYSISEQRSNKSLRKNLMWNWFIQCN